MIDFLPNLLPPEAKKVLILAPHPDDEILGCGGTIVLYTKNDIDVYLSFISNGEKAELKLENMAEIRRSEAAAVSDILNIKKTIFLDFPDEKISEYKEQIKEKLTGIIKDISPDLIYAPFPMDPHPDHRATSEVALSLMSLMREVQGFKIAFYEIYHPIRFNVLVDISSVIHKKKEAVLTYKKSLLDIPETFWYSVEGLDAYRSLLVKKKGFYEAFWLIDKPVSRDEIMKWSTFDYNDTSAEIFLSKLKVADELIYELRKAHVALERKDAEISNLSQTLKETERKLLAAEGEKQELEPDLNLLTSSLFWRFISRFYKARDKFLPQGTKRRNLYSKMIERLKKIT